MKKISLLFSILVLLNIQLPYLTQAEPLNVLDCLDDEADCLELEEENSEQEETEDNVLEAEQFKTGSLVLNIVKMVFALLLVLALIYLVVKFLGSRQKLGNRVNALENMGGISVGQNKSIQIIRMGSTFYLVGVGENVELLKEITDPDIIESLLQQEDEDDFPIHSLFGSLFQKNHAKKEHEQRSNTNEFQSKLKQELNKIQFNRKNLIDKHTEKEDEHD